MIFLSNSIDDIEKDIIGFDTYAEKLNSAIEEGAQMIAITSPFGSGKTSVVELLKKRRKEKENEKFLHIQMWSELNNITDKNNSCELHKNFLYQIGSAINQRTGTYINRRLSNNYGLLKLHSNRPIYWVCLIAALLFAGFGWLSKNHSDLVLKYIPYIKEIIVYLPTIFFFFAIAFLLFVLIGAEIIFSSKASETQRIIEQDEIIDIYRNEIINKKSKFVSQIYKFIKKYILEEDTKLLKEKNYIVVIEDLDRTNDGKAVIHFLKELRKYYILSNKEDVYQNRIVFIVNIKPESNLYEESPILDHKERTDKSIKPKEEGQGNDKGQEDNKDKSTIKTKNKENTLYSKLFDYILNLQTINITDYDTVLCGLLNENKSYFKKHDIESPSNKLSDIPGMQWIIRGNHLGIREIKNRLNIASVIFETLKERFPLSTDGIEFKKCAAAAYLMTEFESDFSKTEDNSFEKLNELYILKDLDTESAKKLLPTDNDNYAKAIVELIEARMISEDYRMYYYNYPKNSTIYSSDETNIRNAILHGVICENFETTVKKVVNSNSDIITKSFKKLRQLEIPLPQIVIKNEFLFLSALKYDKSYVFEVFDRINDLDETLNKNITTIIDILKYDIDRKMYTPEMISEFCGCWEKVFKENHLVSLRETICAFFNKEIHLYKQLFFGEHSTITTKEMALLPFNDALDLLNVESKNFSVSHLQYIISRFLEEFESRNIVSDKICNILIYACKIFSAKEISEYILEYMLITNRMVEELEKTVWNLLNEDPIDSDDEEESGITFDKQNELFQKYKEVINSIPLSDISDIVLNHINSIDAFDEPYSYTYEISNLLFERGYHFISVLINLHAHHDIDYSNNNVIECIKDNKTWLKNNKNVFLKLRKNIIMCAEKVYDYQFCFTSDFPLLTKEEFILLTNNKGVNLQNVLDFFPSDIINEEAVEYISKFFNKEFVNNNDSFPVLKKISKYTTDIIKLFFEKIDFSHSFLYYTFAKWRKNDIKRTFEEDLELDTNEGKLKFMEYTKYLDERFEKELIGNTDENMESRYVTLVKRKLGPPSISSSTIEMLKSFSKYYSFSNYSGINNKLFEDEEYEYYVVSKTLFSKRFIMETGERLEKIWPTYIEIFSNPSRLSQTVSYMKANKEFLEKIMKSGIYTGFDDIALEQLSSIKQDEKLIAHVYNQGSAFAIQYFSAMEDGFVDDKAAKAFIDLLGADSNREILKSDAVRNNIYEKLVDPILKGKYTRLRKSHGYEQ